MGLEKCKWKAKELSLMSEEAGEIWSMRVTQNVVKFESRRRGPQQPPQ